MKFLSCLEEDQGQPTREPTRVKYTKTSSYLINAVQDI